MNDSPEAAAKSMLDLQGEVKELLRNHAIAVRKLQDVIRTLDALEVIGYSSGPVLEGYVEAELRDGSALSWLLEVSWDNEGWAIDARLARSSRDRQDTLKEFSTEKVRDLGQFAIRLKEVVGRLLRVSLVALND